MTFIFLDKKWHQMETHADGTDSTVCGVTEFPYYADWQRKEPTEDRCPKCFKADKKAK